VASTSMPRRPAPPHRPPTIVPLYSAGWDNRVRTTRGRACDAGLRVGAQPNAMCVGMRVVAVMTVGGVRLVRHRRGVAAAG
jgi:hypothetical protein